MKSTYKTIHEYGEDEIIISKSRFIGYAKPIENEDEAISFIEEIKSKHRDATHNVYAYVVGENSNIQRYSDDGEPSGTAGIPVLEVIKKEDLRNVVVVVTRYYGGTKLGAGGLVRAYTKGAKIGIEAGNIVEKVLFKKIKIRIDYTLYGRAENELLRQEYIIEDVIYDDAVNIVVLCEASNVDNLMSLMTEITSANMTHEEGDEDFYSVKEGKLIR
ncbi:putative IMPACT domain-containing protein [Gottschalkia acidurici 9a]|uniref:IMPACT domain-containing protein n=1 Tax=Gottschalkia acidurici (strain ATCC 7906 / DSM 604 / BCRC 14475 / CIP 104303 / KCTC 5404 / NCIMB 10678 / 9a) TaxID=1128398 RepID=K0AVZ0_GOTA9|nr:putative IMPACT domain-containing protein [Gottschalkia acidurici 9a]